MKVSLATMLLITLSIILRIFCSSSVSVSMARKRGAREGNSDGEGGGRQTGDERQRQARKKAATTRTPAKRARVRSVATVLARKLRRSGAPGSCEVGNLSARGTFSCSNDSVKLYVSYIDKLKKK